MVIFALVEDLPRMGLPSVEEVVHLDLDYCLTEEKKEEKKLGNHLIVKTLSDLSRVGGRPRTHCAEGGDRGAYSVFGGIGPLSLPNVVSLFSDTFGSLYLASTLPIHGNN